MNDFQNEFGAIEVPIDINIAQELAHYAIYVNLALTRMLSFALMKLIFRSECIKHQILDHFQAI